MVLQVIAFPGNLPLESRGRKVEKVGEVGSGYDFPRRGAPATNTVTDWLTTRALPVAWFLRCRLQRLVWPRAGWGRLVKLFNNPLTKYGALLDALGPRDSAEL